MFGSKAFLTALVLLHVVQFSEGKTWWKRYAGYCNAASSNCGAGCNVDSDCPGGACWAEIDDCGTSGYCNAASSNCGAGCNTANDCPGGDCWKNMDDCDDTPTGDHIVGTYLGALPGGIPAPLLSSVPSEVNYMLLGFAKDPSQMGDFEEFSMWVSMGITYDSITSDKAANPGRKYLISIGGAADWGGTFGIAGGMSVSQWVDNADNSISNIVYSYNADGVDIQVSTF